MSRQTFKTTPMWHCRCLHPLPSLHSAYSCAIILLEVQDTLREPPRAVKSMKKTVPSALTTTFTLVRIARQGEAAVGCCRAACRSFFLERRQKQGCGQLITNDIQLIP